MATDGVGIAGVCVHRPRQAVVSLVVMTLHYGNDAGETKGSGFVGGKGAERIEDFEHVAPAQFLTISLRNAMPPMPPGQMDEDIHRIGRLSAREFKVMQRLFGVFAR